MAKQSRGTVCEGPHHVIKMDGAVALLKDHACRGLHCGKLPALLCLDLKALQLPWSFTKGKPEQNSDRLSTRRKNWFGDDNPKKVPDGALWKRVFSDDEEMKRRKYSTCRNASLLRICNISNISLPSEIEGQGQVWLQFLGQPLAEMHHC